MTMIEKVCNFIRENDMLQDGDTVVCGLSGGADSVCLLLSLLKNAERQLKNKERRVKQY